MITATFSRSVNSLLAAQYLSVASYYSGPANNCSYTTSEDNDYVSIAVPFVGGNCNTTREVCLSVSDYGHFALALSWL